MPNAILGAGRSGTWRWRQRPARLLNLAIDILIARAGLSLQRAWILAHTKRPAEGLAIWEQERRRHPQCSSTSPAFLLRSWAWRRAGPVAMLGPFTDPEHRARP
jgi:hypothetical protein